MEKVGNGVNSSPELRVFSFCGRKAKLEHVWFL